MAKSDRPQKGETRNTIDQTSVAAPYGPAQPSINAGLTAADTQFQAGPAPWMPGGTHAGFGQGTTDAIAALRAQANGPSAASTYLTDMASGGAENPFLRQLLDQGSERIGNQVKAAYSSRGRYGSTDFTDALARGVSEFQTPLLYSAYEGDQGRRLAATGQIDSQRFAGTNQLLGAGQMEDANSQAQRDAELQKWLYEHGGGAQQSLEDYINQIGGLAGQYGTATTTGTNSSRERPTPFLNLLKGLGGIVGGFA